MTKPLIVMALEIEGQGKLEALGYDVIYCGVGKINSTYYLTRKLIEAKHEGKTYPLVLNLGTAGSTSFPPFALVAADSFVQRDMDATGIGFEMGETPFDKSPSVINFPRVFESLPHGICGSGDSFLHGMTPTSCNIIDMEAYALAKVCMLENVPFACVKFITDGADTSAANDWETNLVKAADAFVQLLEG